MCLESPNASAEGSQGPVDVDHAVTNGDDHVVEGDAEGGEGTINPSCHE